MLITIENREVVFLRAAIQRKYMEFQGTNSLKYTPLAITSYKERYLPLVDSFEVELASLLKNKEISQSSLGLPREGFFVKLFYYNNDSDTFRLSNLNACYMYAFGKTRDAYLNTPLKKAEEDIFETIYSIRLAKYDDLRKIYSLSTTVYTGIDVIPLETMISWYEKNPYIYYVLVNEFDEVVGNVNVLPLKEESLKAFIEGKKIERDFKEQDIYGVDEREKINFLHVESIVNFAGPAGLLQLIKRIPTIITDFGCTHESIKKVYCISASNSGAKLIRKMGFKQLESTNRLDNHNIYEADVMDIIHIIYRLLA